MTALPLAPTARAALDQSRRAANAAGHASWTALHVASAAVEQAAPALAAAGIDTSKVQSALEEALARLDVLPGPFAPPAGSRPAPEVDSLIAEADREAQELGREAIQPAHLLLAALRSASAKEALGAAGVTPDMLREAASREEPETGAEGPPLTRALAAFGRDLTALARTGDLDPVIGREAEIERLLQVLSRRVKNTPVLIGEAGVGKTAIVEGLAQRIADGHVPAAFAGRRLVALDLGALVAGSGARGQFEERLQAVVGEVERARRSIILFVDEVHTLVGAGASEGGFDASALVKPALARGSLPLVGATTPEAYRRHIEHDAALERRLSPVWVAEPSPADTLRILDGLRPRYEAFHGVSFSDGALEAAVRLSHRYLTARRLPDKAIDLIDEAASRASLRWQPGDPRPELEADSIARLVSAITGIPLGRLQETESERLRTLEDRIHRRLVAQDHAVHAVAEAVRRNRAGLGDARRPIASFLFLGPSGVGKTELARALAEALFDDPDALVRLDMSEYMERHNVARLFGAPPGYVGYDEAGALTELVRRRPYRVLLFDEIEKAHPDVFNVLLQVMDAGRMTDNHGRVVDFRNTVLVLTSNVATGDRAEDDEERARRVEEALRVTFRPEFRNRLDAALLFDPLSQPQVLAILDLQLRELAANLRVRGFELRVSPAARKALAAEGFSPAFGARPLRRTIELRVTSLLTAWLLGAEREPGRLTVGHRSGRYSLSFEAAPVSPGESQPKPQPRPSGASRRPRIAERRQPDPALVVI